MRVSGKRFTQATGGLGGVGFSEGIPAGVGVEVFVASLGVALPYV